MKLEALLSLGRVTSKYLLCEEWRLFCSKNDKNMLQNLSVYVIRNEITVGKITN